MQVKLSPLEFTDCLTDSPIFRHNLSKHEKQVEQTSLQIKQLIKEVQDLMFFAKHLSQAQRNLAKSLHNFTFECIGGSQTDDESVITKSLKEFARLISVIEDERDRMLCRAHDHIIVPLKNFRKNHIGDVKEGKKKFDKQSTKYCQTQERYLNLSIKKQENILQEADASLDMADRHFFQASMEYVFLLQEVQERKKFEFVEIILSFMIGWLTFYHQGHEIATDSKAFMQDLQFCIQKARENFDETRNQTESLKKKMLETRQQAMEKPNRLSKDQMCKEGYLFLMEKKAFGSTWTKQYCTFNRETKEFTILPFNQLNTKNVSTNPEKMLLESCVRRMSDTIDKRFCFDVSFKDRPGLIYTFQALNEDDRKAWLQILDGKEPMYSLSSLSRQQKINEFQLDETGINFVKKCIEILEKRGLSEQGLYRVVGVSSKVNRLLAMGLDRRKIDNFADCESKTITSALKTYLRNLPEPIMTYKNYTDFIRAAKNESKQNRIDGVHYLVHQLPKPNFEVLKLLVEHLVKVSKKSNVNLMTIGNLGVCFGPTLLRPEEETVASIIDLKFYSVVIDILIENFDVIFGSKPKLDRLLFETNQTSEESPLKIVPMKPRLICSAPGPATRNQIEHRRITAVQKQPFQLQVTPPQPVTHAITKTYYDGPNLINMSSSLYNVSTIPEKNCQNGVNSTQTNYSIGTQPIRQITAQSETNLHTLMQFSTPKTQSNEQTNLLNFTNNSITSTSSSNDSMCSSSSSTKDILNNTRKINSLSLHYATGYQSSKSANLSKYISTFDLTFNPPNILAPTNLRRARTLFACTAENDTELSFEANQIITNVKISHEPGWLQGTLNGKTGLIPENYVEMLP